MGNTSGSTHDAGKDHHAGRVLERVGMGDRRDRKRKEVTMDALTFGFVMLVWFGGFATGWISRMSEEYMRKEE